MCKLRLCFIVFLECFLFCLTKQLNLNEIKVWGPGLDPENVIMPARYFFIDSNMNLNSSHSSENKPIFKINVNGINKHKINCRIWVNILDRNDGSFIVRYKLYETCFKFKIEIMYETNHIADSPYIFDKPVHADECNCPEQNLSVWLKHFQCKETYMKIEMDLIPFSYVNFTEIRPKILALYNKPASHSICNYIILNNKIYRKCYGKYVGFNMFMDSILLSLARKVQLPDVELFVNLGDWPLAPKNKKALPIFSWCGSDDSYDIVMPTYDITDSTLQNMGRVMLDMLSIQGNIKYPWNKKIPKIFWRGRDSNQRRLDLIDISRKYPDLFNVSLTNFFFFRNEIDKYGPKAEHVSFFSFFDYKYQLNIDGTVAAYRFPYLLAGDSLVFKQFSKYYEWFYKLLTPGVHYIEIKEDLSDLVDKVNWAIENDAEAQKIAINGQNFARKHLMPQNIFCYYAVLLKKWSERLVSPVEILEEMELVEQPDSNPICDCSETLLKDEL